MAASNDARGSTLESGFLAAETGGRYILKPDQPAALLAAWETMISLLTTTTKVKAIGVSNFSTTHLKPLLHTSHPPMINQIEIHPYFPNTHLISFCAQHKIQAVAYSPLGSQGQTVRQGQTVATNLRLKHHDTTTRPLL
ncbi:putative reductase 1 [Glarea lozoyensis 74030]|uniref:Putative reductase 1 n=1 Tax=Glarea lozoyensis (strain ATCC 74030 / MF5533) TaxID=1104152 RepID=H0EN82_GLAL7|nr:putative reductase 1 [Glarea lozoyensis 74030]